MDDQLDEQSFRDLAMNIFLHSPHGADSLIDRLLFTNDGVIATASESCGTLGFGIASGVTLTAEVLSVVEDLNRLMVYGHYWLASGADNNNWSLVCGFKFPYDQVDPQATANLIARIMRHNGDLVLAVRQRLENIPHRPYWLPDATAGAQAIVLVGHLS
ncbi:hypothetical protein FCK90_15110 [Kocuria coralli]|uniref:YbjN domain-containing protein n=1 Tax=Kocuria coralli TaxID=1461025 RepID=A0A5J5KVK4_9MICC|nr:hypothetical protein [Kocuria coralli]KAA9392885.1 hypothetical protein FCK90_15110 [Kocuria coralli]